MEQIADKVGVALIGLMRAHRSKAERELNRLGLYVGQEVLILQLAKQNGLSQGELAACFGVEPPTVSKMLQRMENNGFITRAKDPDDARVTRVYLTDKGRALEPEIIAIWDGLEQQMFDGVSDLEKALLRRVLEQMARNLED